jgi:predicted phosphodiesterase
MSIFITGDTHGTFDAEKLSYFDGKDDLLSKEDYLIICGDVAVCGLSDEDDREVKDLLHSLPVTVLFIDGNHENFEKLNSYPVEEWHGGLVHILEDDIIHLMRGQVFHIDGKTFFTMGGAHSADYMYREPYVNWFPEELSSEKEMEDGLQNLESAGNHVDYILTHTGPSEAVAAMGPDFAEKGDGEEDAFQLYLQKIADRTEFRDWYFGHFHEDIDIGDGFHCVFDDIVRLPET